MTSGVRAGKRGLGPRYIVFAKDIAACYVVNELSSQVAVFEYLPDVAQKIAAAAEAAETAEAKAESVRTVAEPTLRLIQTVSTVPEAFPFEMNTCADPTPATLPPWPTVPPPAILAPLPSRWLRSLDPRSGVAVWRCTRRVTSW